ncbi:MAG: T9SS type A sorting domain-containing protein [Muribaculaceae bacterium]|nr:T9SS type A sorting domain-containing protein [Muribaculaceae bacterium]
MNKRFVTISLVLVAAAQLLTVSAVTRSVARRDADRQEQLVASADGVEIYGNNGVITIKSNHKTTVRVFTILGQLVSTTSIQPGTTRIKVASRGIYIVKVDNITQKIAL